MLGSDMTVCWSIKDKVLLVFHTTKQFAKQATPTHVKHLLPTSLRLSEDHGNLF